MPKTVTRQRRGCDLNPGRSAPESSTLTTRPPSHPHWPTHCSKTKKVHETAPVLLATLPNIHRFSTVSLTDSATFLIRLLTTPLEITPNLLFEYQCTSGKFIRLPNRNFFCPNWNALPATTHKLRSPTRLGLGLGSEGKCLGGTCRSHIWTHRCGSDI